MNPIEYTKAGTHTYTLREVKGNAGGITYSDAKFTIETTITDKGDGTLEAKHVLEDGVKAATFENAYSVTPIDTELDFGLRGTSSALPSPPPRAPRCPTPQP